MLQVKDIIVKGKGDKQRAVGVRLSDGRVFRGKAVVSNATRWDTFEKLLAREEMPKSERLFRQANLVCPTLHAFRLQAMAWAPAFVTSSARGILSMQYFLGFGACAAMLHKST